MNVLSFKREAIFQEDGSICDPKTGEIRTLHSASSEPEADRTGPEIAAKFIADSRLEIWSSCLRKPRRRLLIL
jgi:hypothetical protein